MGPGLGVGRGTVCGVFCVVSGPAQAQHLCVILASGTCLSLSTAPRTQILRELINKKHKDGRGVSISREGFWAPFELHLLLWGPLEYEIN